MWTATFVVALQKMLFFVHKLEGFVAIVPPDSGLADAIMNALEHDVHSTEPHSFRITYSGDSNYSIVGATEGNTLVHQAIVAFSEEKKYENRKWDSPPLSVWIRSWLRGSLYHNKTVLNSSWSVCNKNFPGRWMWCAWIMVRDVGGFMAFRARRSVGCLLHKMQHILHWIPFELVDVKMSAFVQRKEVTQPDEKFDNKTKSRHSFSRKQIFRAIHQRWKEY